MNRVTRFRSEIVHVEWKDETPCDEHQTRNFEDFHRRLIVGDYD